MAKYCICKPDGFIECQLNTESEEVAQNQPAVLEGGFFVRCDNRTISEELEYIDPETRKVRLRKDYSFNALPLPCTLIIEGVEYPCNEQPEISFDAPGEFTVIVEAGGPYLRKEFRFEN